MKKYTVKWEEIYRKVETIKRNLIDKNSKIFGIGISGQIIAGLTGNAVEYPENAVIIVHDIYDSGDTYKKWLKLYPEKEYVFLYNKQFEHKDEEIEFP